MNIIVIDDRLAVGPQPDKKGLSRLASTGFKSVINLRSDTENEEVLTPEDEGRQALLLGMKYARIPIPRNEPLHPEYVNGLRNRIRSLPRPIYIHCRWGKRAGALTWAVVARERGLSGGEALATADRMGLTSTPHYKWRPPVRKFVRDYLDRSLT